jgi:hypothetical protein
MREMSATEQRYKAALAVIGDRRTVGEVVRDLSISRRTMHLWLPRYEDDGLEGLNNRSHRPARCPHQSSSAVEAMVLELTARAYACSNAISCGLSSLMHLACARCARIGKNSGGTHQRGLRITQPRVESWRNLTSPRVTGYSPASRSSSAGTRRLRNQSDRS